MAEYINRMAAIKAINEYCDNREINDGRLWAGLQVAKQIILDQQAADVVEVVRCRECIHKRDNLSYRWCSNSTHFGHIHKVKDNDYCSYGERREDTDNDK